MLNYLFFKTSQNPVNGFFYVASQSVARLATTVVDSHTVPFARLKTPMVVDSHTVPFARLKTPMVVDSHTVPFAR